MKVAFIGREDFIKNKKATGRAKDMVDVRKIQPKTLKRKAPTNKIIKPRRKK